MSKRVLLPDVHATGATRATAPAKTAKTLVIAGSTPSATRVLLRVRPHPIEPGGTRVTRPVLPAAPSSHAGLLPQVAQVASRPGSITLNPAGDPCAPCPTCSGTGFHRPPGGIWSCSTCEPPRLRPYPAPVAEMPDPRTAPIGKCAEVCRLRVHGAAGHRRQLRKLHLDGPDASRRAPAGRLDLLCRAAPSGSPPPGPWRACRGQPHPTRVSFSRYRMNHERPSLSPSSGSPQGHVHVPRRDDADARGAARPPLAPARPGVPDRRRAGDGHGRTWTSPLYRSTVCVWTVPALQGCSGAYGMLGANCLRVSGLRSASQPMALMDDPRAWSRLRQRA